MNTREESGYRLRLAQGFLEEAEQDLQLERWRSCVANCQLAVENSGKAILSILGASPRTHDPGQHVARILKTAKIDSKFSKLIEEILPDLTSLGTKEHFLTDYGDEADYLSPWEIFTKESAQDAIVSTRTCVTKTEQVLSSWL